METTLASRSTGLRIGDSERERCADLLIDHHLHGRLSLEELEARQQAALAAVTQRDLDVLVADLPGGAPTRAIVGRPRVPAAPGAGAVRLVLPVTAVVGSSMFAQWFWQYSAEGALLGGLLGGVVGYASHALSSRSAD